METFLENEISAVLLDYERRVQAGDISENTLKAVQNSFYNLRNFWAKRRPSDVSKESWAEFQDWFEKLNPNGSHFNVKKYMVVLVNSLFEKGLIKQKIPIKDRFARRERTQRRANKNWVYTKDEIDALDKACLTTDERVQLRLGYLMAFRISDCAKLTWERVITTEKYSYINFSGSEDKASKIARCPLPTSLLELIQQVPKTSRWVFPQKRKPDKHIMTQQINFGAIKKRAGVTRGSFHSLRHYRLTEDCANPNLTLAQISKMRRVSVQVLMEHYVHTREDDMTIMLRETK